jgi:hypothetical protein
MELKRLGRQKDDADPGVIPRIEMHGVEFTGEQGTQ